MDPSADRPAVFLDRDGTLIDHVHHLTDPAAVRLVDGAAEALRRLQRAGYACVVVSNQSVVGRGLLDVAGLDRVHQRLDAQLGAAGVTLDGLYWCPHVPRQADPEVVEHPDRKPGPGMLQRAARDMHLALDRSWMIGDSVSDLLAGRHAGCRGSVLVLTGQGASVPRGHRAADHVAPDLQAAATWILEQAEGRGANPQARPDRT